VGQDEVVRRAIGVSAATSCSTWDSWMPASGFSAPLQQGVAAERREDPHGPSPSVAIMSALMVCIRFSAWSNTTDAATRRPHR
jgi:hypothetical protein